MVPVGLQHEFYILTRVGGLRQWFRDLPIGLVEFRLDRA